MAGNRNIKRTESQMWAKLINTQLQRKSTVLSYCLNDDKVITQIEMTLSPIHTADADATKLFCRVASAVCT